MKMVFARLVLITMLALALAESPVQKAIELLSGLETKLNADAARENSDYEAYVAWCKDGKKDKEFEISTATRDIEEFKATQEKATSDMATESSRIQDLSSSIAADEADLNAATKIRDEEHEAFGANEKELMDSINTLERAINLLERNLHGSALLQTRIAGKGVSELIRSVSSVIDAAAFSTGDKQKLLELVQSSQNADDSDLGAPSPEAYQSHSGSILDVLEDLKQKAVVALGEVRQSETTGRHNYELLKQSLNDQGSADNREHAQTKQRLAEASESKATADGDLAQTSKTLADAENVLASTASDCKTKADDHAAAAKNFAEELRALSEAKAALMDVASVAGQVYDSASFLQTGSHHLRSSIDLVHFEVANVVRKLAKKEHSAELAQLAAHISSVIEQGARTGADPFSKVRAMISQMLESLQKDAQAEASHKAYCDQEFGETRQKIDELKHDIDKFSAKVDKTSAESATLKEDVAILHQDLAESARQQSAADQQRTTEHATYAQLKADLEQGLRGVRLAAKVLREYYADTQSGTGTTVTGLLEVVESDFSRSLANANLDEEAAAAAYERMSMETKLSTTVKQKDVEYKAKEAARLDKELAELSSDRDSSQTELDAVLDYSKHIRNMCEVRPESYSDRAARREAELAGLKDALAILNGQSMLLQRGVRHLRGVTTHTFEK